MSQARVGDSSSNRNQRFLNSGASKNKLDQLSNSISSSGGQKPALESIIQDCLTRAIQTLASDDIVRVMLSSKTTQPFAQDRVIEVVLAKVEDSIADLVQKLGETESACGLHAKQAEECRHELNTERNLGAQMQVRIQELRKEVESSQRKIAEMQAYKEKLGMEFSAYNNQSGKLQRDLEKYKSIDHSLRQELDKLKTDLQLSTKLSSQLETDLKILKTELQESLISNQSMKVEIESLKDHLSKEENKNHNDLSSLISQLNSSQAARTSEVASLKSEHKDIQNKLRDELMDLQARLDTTTQDSEVSKNANMRDVHQTKKDLENTYEQRFAMMHTEYEDKITRILHDTDDMKAQFEDRIQWFRDHTVKKDVYEAVVSEKAQLSNQLLDNLKKQEAIYKVTASPANKLDHSANSSKSAYKFITDNAVGINTALQVKLDHLDSEIKSLTAALNTRDQQLTDKDNEINACQTKNHALHNKLKTLTSELQSRICENATIDQLHRDIKHKSDIIQSMQLDMQINDKENKMKIHALENQIDELNRHVKDAELNIASYMNTIKDMGLEASLKTKEAAESIKSQTNDKIDEQQIEIDRLRQELKSNL